MSHYISAVHILQDESAIKVLNYSAIYYGTYLKQLRPLFAHMNIDKQNNNQHGFLQKKTQKKQNSLFTQIISFQSLPVVTLTTYSVE